MEDIDKVLAFEIKKDIAERYFSFRKVIEQDSASYLDAVIASSGELEATIGLDLVRLYILLQDDDLIVRFQKLIALSDDVFYDPYICASPSIRARVFKGLPVHGFTRKGRFKNLFYELYDRLAGAARSFRETIEELVERHETIREQINLFYRRNDLDTILAFIRSLDSAGEGSSLMTEAPAAQGGESLEKKMRIEAPTAVADLLPEIPVLPERDLIRRAVRDLLEEAYRRRPELEVRDLV